MKLLDQGAGEPVPDREPKRGIQPARHCSRTNGAQWLAAARDVEYRIDPRHGLERDGRDITGVPALSDIAPDVGKLEELAASVAPAQRTADRTGITAAAMEIAVSSMGIGLQTALPAGKMPVGVGHLPVAGDVEQRGRRRSCGLTRAGFAGG